MDRPASSVLGLVLYVVHVLSPATQSGEIAEAQLPTSPTITITRFEVDDQVLQLNWTIRNDTDHEVWICDSATDWFMDTDNETLVIRKRYNISNAGMIWEIPFPRFWYSRLRPGEQKIQSMVGDVPLDLDLLFKASLGNAKHARRVALEIGYYDEDLRALILDIVNMAERLDCNTSAISVQEPEKTLQLYKRFFGGLTIAQVFNVEHMAYFRDSVLSNDDDISMPYMDQALNGEKVLRTEINSVTIPYESKYPPLTGQGDPPNSREDAGVKAALTRMIVDDQSFEMGWKIINNTDHDVWICDSSSDLFMDTDNETLVIRMRYNISNEGEHWGFPFPRFRYSRLRPGEQKVMLIIRPVPVWPSYLFKVSDGNAEYARRVALEIGYYDEDLQALILDIVNMAERLDCDASAVSLQGPEDTLQLYRRFFGGLTVGQMFNVKHAGYFRDSVTSGGDEIIAPYFRQALHGEQVLRLEVDNVSIAFGRNHPPLP